MRVLKKIASNQSCFFGIALALALFAAPHAASAAYWQAFIPGYTYDPGSGKSVWPTQYTCGSADTSCQQSNQKWKAVFGATYGNATQASFSDAYNNAPITTAGSVTAPYSNTGVVLEWSCTEKYGIIYGNCIAFDAFNNCIGGNTSTSWYYPYSYANLSYPGFNSNTARSGSYTVYPTATTQYTLVCVGNSTPVAYQNKNLIVTVNVAPPASCTFNGSSVAHGASVTAYQSSSVPYGSSCVSETRTCNNGTLSGSFTNPSCSVGAAASCNINGATVAHGASVTAYQSSSVPYGSSCVSETRTCNNGTPTGSYAYPSCSVAADPCPSYIETPWQGSGLLLYPYATRKITQAGYNKCATNNTGSYYFIGASSAGELQSFFNVAGSLGVSVY